MKLPSKRRRWTSVLAAFGFVTVGLVCAQPAQASTPGYIYVSYPTWLANCPNGGSATGINAAVDVLWSTPAGGDWGDDLVYPRVRLNDWNTISAQNSCNRPWYQGGPYWGPVSSVQIYPTRYNQTFWVGPAGQSHN